MEDTRSIEWLDLLLRMVFTLAALLIAFVIRRAWSRVSREYDRSMLIRLGTDDGSREYENAPVIVGRFPFSVLEGKVRSNLDVRDVIGFVVGRPKWMETVDLKRLRIAFDPKFHRPGYYAYCVVQWEHAHLVKRLEGQGFHIRRTGYTGRKGEPNMRERIFVGFSTDRRHRKAMAAAQWSPI